jgi:hypothetical protein
MTTNPAKAPQKNDETVEGSEQKSKLKNGH